MILIPTFTLAAYEQGDPAAPRLALVLPGRLDTKDYAHMRSHVDALASQGFYALSFDPPGTWESPGGTGLYTTTNYLRAINELIEHFGNKPTVLVGHSRGGSMAMVAGVANPHVTHFVAIMSHAGPTAVGLPRKPGEAAISQRDLPPGTTRTTEKKIFTLPYSYFEDQSHYDALEDLKQCLKPKLFFYGTKDVLVTPASVQEMYELAAAPKQLHELQSEHDYRLHPPIIEEVNRVISDFLAD